MKSRRKFEDQFRDTYLLPVFQNLDQVIQNAQENLSKAEDMTSIKLFR